MSENVDHYYFYSENEKIVYYSTSLPEVMNDLIFLGVSDNKNLIMAASYFTKDLKQPSGYKVRPYSE